MLTLSIILHLASFVAWMTAAILLVARTNRAVKSANDTVKNLRDTYDAALKRLNNQLIASIYKNATPPDDLESGVK